MSFTRCPNGGFVRNANGGFLKCRCCSNAVCSGLGGGVPFIWTVTFAGVGGPCPCRQTIELQSATTPFVIDGSYDLECYTPAGIGTPPDKWKYRENGSFGDVYAGAVCAGAPIDVVDWLTIDIEASGSSISLTAALRKDENGVGGNEIFRATAAIVTDCATTQVLNNSFTVCGSGGFGGSNHLNYGGTATLVPVA